MSLKLLRAGPLSLIQDYGRYGYQDRGMSNSGPADEHAFLWANRLLGNKPRVAALEISLGPCLLRAEHACNIAICGADMNPQINGDPVANWASHALQTGDELRLHVAETGLRSYIAVSGGFCVEPHFGSCATAVREQIGGLFRDGSALQDGDELACVYSKSQSSRSVPSSFIPDYRQPLNLGVITAYQYQDFEPAQRDVLFNNEYRVSQNADRMGYRLSGPPLRAPSGTLLSEGIALGAIQITPDGQPIILLKDRQTIGGYPKLGCITALDAAALAQRRPGDTLRFTPANLADAIQQRRQFEQFFGID